MSNYYQWESHGEDFVPISKPQLGTNIGNEISANRTSINSYRIMIFDTVGPNFNLDIDVYDMDVDDEELPNQNTQRLFEMLKTAKESLFDGCLTHSSLLVVCRLLNIKFEFNISDNCYN